MADHRFIQIEEIEEEEEFETEDDEIEIEEIVIPERINLPVHHSNSNQFHVLEENDTDSDDYDEDDDYDSDYDDDDIDEEEDEVNLNPDIILPVNLDQLEDEDDSDSDDDFNFDDEEEDDEDDDEEEEEDGEDYEDDDGEVVEEMIPVEMDRDVSNTVYADRSVVMENVTMENPNEVDGTKDGEVVNRREIDGLICPICFEAWTSGGQHQISCLPCGHIYGLSCIKKWLLQRRSSGKCPQCNQLCTLKNVRVLYASRLCVADEELHKRVRSLEAKCASLELKAAPLTHDELINQICSNPTLVERLATALAGLH